MSNSARKKRTRTTVAKRKQGLDVEPRPGSLAGKTAIVTGSSKGLGKAMAIALGEAGARVVVNFYNGKEVAEKTYDELVGRGVEAIVCRADVTNERQVNKLVAQTEKKLGKPDIVVLNATPDQPQLPIEKYDWAFYQSMLDFFVKSPYLVTRAVLPGMKRRKWGRIISIGSEVFRRGVPNFSAYVAAKGAQAGWSRSMATELAPWNITVNTVSPGWIPVERHDKDPKALKDGYEALIPMGRWGVPAEVGGIVSFLASEQAAFITGQDIAVNGGMTVG